MLHCGPFLLKALTGGSDGYRLGARAAYPIFPSAMGSSCRFSSTPSAQRCPSVWLSQPPTPISWVHNSKTQLPHLTRDALGGQEAGRPKGRQVKSLTWRPAHGGCTGSTASSNDDRTQVHVHLIVFSITPSPARSGNAHGMYVRV